MNRGNYRSWIFESDGAKKSFEKSLFETCERGGWKLHAYCVMGNHFHLALETPEPNLSEGMRLLQSVFSLRFNKFRQEKGRIFQGRFKSVVIEDMERLGWLCHYIHLNPVRAGVCDIEGLKSLDCCSYRYLWDKRERPGFLSFEACLESAGKLRDATGGRRKYSEYLEWLAADEPRQKAMLFDRMSKGWAVGTKEFKTALLEDEKSIKACLELGRDAVREIREALWESKIERCIEALGSIAEEKRGARKSEDWKVAVAGLLKQGCLCPNGWLCERLDMGTASSVSRYVGEMLGGKRSEALSQYRELVAKVGD